MVKSDEQLSKEEIRVIYIFCDVTEPLNDTSSSL